MLETELREHMLHVLRGVLTTRSHVAKTDYEFVSGICFYLQRVGITGVCDHA